MKNPGKTADGRSIAPEKLRSFTLGKYFGTHNVKIKCGFTLNLLTTLVLSD